MFGQALNSRPNGVLIPNNTSTEEAPVQQLIAFSEIKTYGIAYGDAEGRKHVGIAVYDGENWYIPPNGEAWADALKAAAKWLYAQMESRRLMAATDGKTDPADVPQQDAVSVMGDVKK